MVENSVGKVENLFKNPSATRGQPEDNEKTAFPSKSHFGSLFFAKEKHCFAEKICCFRFNGRGCS